MIHCHLIVLVAATFQHHHLAHHRVSQRHASPAASAEPEWRAARSYTTNVPYGEGLYDPAAAATFFKSRPIAALRRAFQLGRIWTSFLVALSIDKWLGRQEQMTAQRSKNLLDLVTLSGPAFIKIGQALSIRTDLLPAPYVAGLTQLQDNVKPFAAAQGRSVIEEELGISLEETFAEISPEPVASASVGQVYKGTLRATGEQVAIKVQRPNVLLDVSLDLFMLRTFAPTFQRANEVNTDLVALVDGARRRTPM